MKDISLKIMQKVMSSLNPSVCLISYKEVLRNNFAGPLLLFDCGDSLSKSDFLRDFYS